MGKRLLIAIATVFVCLSAEAPSFWAFGDNTQIVDRPKDMSSPTKEEKGILGTLVMLYTKTRNAVKFAYNEVMYYREMRQNFSNMQKWFDRAKKRASNVWDETTQLIKDPKNVFYTLEKMQEIFDNIDYAVEAIPEELDNILAKTELTFDKIGSPTKEYAAMLPNTDEVLKYIDEKLGFNYLSNTADPEIAEYAKRRAQDQKNGSIMNFPEEELVTSSKIVAASGMANAAMYQNWATKAYQNIDNTDNIFANVQGANGNDLAACWYSIDQTNSNNKLLRNHLEELRILQATLGIYAYQMSEDRMQQLRYHSQLNDVGDALETIKNTLH
jgi:hypothetical protein